MARIFLGLAVFAVLLLIASIGVGYWIDDFSGSVQTYLDADRAVKKWEQDSAGEGTAEAAQARAALSAASEHLDRVKNQRTFHTLLGIAASLVTVLVSSITVTYFVGTSRWCQEVTDAYHLDRALTQRSKRLKRSAFPWALSSMLAIVVIVVTGPFADLASSAHVWLKSTPLAEVSIASWVSLHAWTCLAATAFIACAFFAQLAKIAANYQIIDEILAHVRQIRESRGLDSSSAPPGGAERIPARRG